jgi:hypothetical protein
MPMVISLKSFTTLWIPDQVAIMKRLMVKSIAEEREFNPNICILKEETSDLERKVQALKSNLLDRRNFIQKAQDKLGPLHQNLHSFQKEV